MVYFCPMNMTWVGKEMSNTSKSRGQEEIKVEGEENRYGAWTDMTAEQEMCPSLKP